MKLDKKIQEMLVSKGQSLCRRDDDKATKRAALNAARDALFLDQLGKSLVDVFRRRPPPRMYRGKKARHIERRVNVVISDTHFGSTLDPKECPKGYGPLEESRRLGKVAAQVVDYKRQYRSESVLSVKILGDIIQGQLHDQREGAPLAAQVAAAIQYLTDALFFWASEYPSVEVYCTTGNHGRVKSRHHDRAVQQKWDSIETIIYTALKTALKKAPNVKVQIPLTPYIIEPIFDKRAFWTHGDTVIKPGYPGRAIQVASLQQQISKWNAARGVGGPFSLFGVGHVHFGSITNMPGGVTMLTNGCLVPPDAYALSIGSGDVSCGQYLFESIRGYPCGDQRFVSVDDADKCPELNRIIPPFRGF